MQQDTVSPSLARPPTAAAANTAAPQDPPPPYQQHDNQSNTNTAITHPPIVMPPPAGPSNPKKQVSPVFHACETEIILDMVVEMLNRLLQHNDRIPLTADTLTRFHSRAPPSISITDYLRRIVKYAAIEKSVLLLMLVYIDRICELHRSFTISSLTAHRFIISSVVVGSKSLSDIYCTNTHFAKVGGISVQELNVLELEFCKLINWRLACSMDALQNYYVNLIRTSTCYMYPAHVPPIKHVLLDPEGREELKLVEGVGKR